MSSRQQDFVSIRRLRLLRLSNVILGLCVALALFFILIGLEQKTRLKRENLAIKLELLKSGTGLVGEGQAQKGDLFPSFKGFKLDGKQAAVAYDGSSRYLLFFFSPQCETYLSQFPLWNEIAKRARDHGDKVLGVSTGSKHDTATNLTSQGFDLVTIEDTAVFRAYRVAMIPMVVVASPEGRVEWLHYGPLTNENTKELVAHLETSRIRK